MSIDFWGLASAPARDGWIAWRMQFQSLTLRVDAGAATHTIRVRPQGIEVAQAGGGDAELALSGPEEAWRNFACEHPPVGFQSLAAMLSEGHITLVGDIVKFFRHLMLLEKLFARLRKPKSGELTQYPAPQIEAVTGRYMRMTMNGRACRVYYEEAGQGIPLICLHTAGSDGRQYRALMNDVEITRNFRVIAFDLPWHGKSAPPQGFQDDLYQLSTDGYMQSVMDFVHALKLKRPCVIGCSIGGRAVIHLALRHGDSFRAAIGLQSATHAENPLGELYGSNDKHVLFRPDIDGGDVSAAAVMQLMSPVCPAQHQWETLWYYMQGGPGVFMGDLNYYFVDGDLRNGPLQGIDSNRCPLYLLTGEYDLSATPEMTIELANAVNARHCEIMEGMGHFPMSEDPQKFRTYLLPVLEKIMAETA